MQVSHVTAGYSDPATLGRFGEAVEAADKSSANRAAGASSQAAGSALNTILSRYDVTEISPAQFTEMIQKLYESGTISESELQQLTTIRHDLDTDGVEPDESVNLLEYYARKIEKSQQQSADSDAGAAGNQRLSPLLRRLDWVQKFAVIQSQPDAAGLDMTV